MTFLQGTTDGTLIIQSPNALIFGTGNASNDVYLKEVAGGLSISQPLSVPSTGIIIPGGSPVLVAKADQTAQAANIGTTILYAVPPNGTGMYRVSAYIMTTQAASVSSSLPQVQIQYTDNDTGNQTGFFQLTGTQAGNGVGFLGAALAQLPFGGVMNCKAGTNINYNTTGYASSGVTPMQYAIHIKLEYLGA